MCRDFQRRTRTLRAVIMKIDVVVRAIVIGEQVEAKSLELVQDQNKPNLDRRRLISYGDYSWLDELQIDQVYTLTIEEKG